VTVLEVSAAASDALLRRLLAGGGEVHVRAVAAVAEVLTEEVW
jgi:uncharacterized protein (DUF2336 family)